MAVHYHLGQFPPVELDWPKLIPLLGPAAAAVARYDGTLAAIPNAAVLSPLTTQEAVLSSRIEGSQATMGEVLEFEADGDAPGLSEARRDDIREVLNYRAAMRMAEKLLATLPSGHPQGVDGSQRTPGGNAVLLGAAQHCRRRGGVLKRMNVPQGLLSLMKRRLVSDKSFRSESVIHKSVSQGEVS